MVRINYGCGSDYRRGWINVDVKEEDKWFSPSTPPDLIVSANAAVLPFSSESVDMVLLDHVLEHVERRDVHRLLLEFHRILKPGGVLEIWVPHFKGLLVKFLEHVRGYGVNSFWYYDRYFDVSQELYLATRSHCANHSGQRFLNVLNPLFNCTNTWQQLCEKYLPGGFEEIHYVMTKRHDTIPTVDA